MKKIVRKQGNSLVMIINKEDRTVFNIEEGDIIDVDILKVTKIKRRKK